MPNNKYTPFMIYQPGRVGSVAVKQALVRVGENPIHVHYLFEPVEPKHGTLQHDRNYVLANLAYPAKIITIIRDPLARAVSAWFRIRIRSEIEPMSPEDIAKNIIDNEYYKWGLTWFDNQLSPFLRMDVRKELERLSFNEKPHVMFVNTKFRVLALKTEELNKSNHILTQFTEKRIDVKPANGTLLRKDIDDLYQKVLEEMWFPDSFLNELYLHPTITTCYSKNEIRKFKQRWSK